MVFISQHNPSSRNKKKHNSVNTQVLGICQVDILVLIPTRTTTSTNWRRSLSWKLLHWCCWRGFLRSKGNTMAIHLNKIHKLEKFKNKENENHQGAVKYAVASSYRTVQHRPCAPGSLQCCFKFLYKRTRRKKFVY